MREFFIEHDGRRTGPYTATQLRAMAADGSLEPDAMVIDPALKQSVPARAVAGLVFPPRSPVGRSAGEPTRSPGLRTAAAGGTGTVAGRAGHRGPRHVAAAAPPPIAKPSSIDGQSSAARAVIEGHPAAGSTPPATPTIPPPPLPAAVTGPLDGETAGIPSSGETLAGNHSVLVWCLLGGGLVMALGVVLTVAVLLASRFGSAGLTAVIDPHVTTVQTGRLDGCPHRTVRELVDGFIRNPRWRSLQADDGLRYVNCRGEIIYAGRPAIAEMQFQVIGESFKLRSLEIDDEPQSLLTIAALIEKMCEE